MPITAVLWLLLVYAYSFEAHALEAPKCTMSSDPETIIACVFPSPFCTPFLNLRSSQSQLLYSCFQDCSCRWLYSRERRGVGGVEVANLEGCVVTCRQLFGASTTFCRGQIVAFVSPARQRCAHNFWYPPLVVLEGNYSRANEDDCASLFVAWVV